MLPGCERMSGARPWPASSGGAAMVGAVVLVCGPTLGCHAIDDGIPRVNGEFLAVCSDHRVCNRESGLCELNPCSKGCGEGHHCEPSRAVPRGAPDGERFSIGAEPKA